MGSYSGPAVLTFNDGLTRSGRATLRSSSSGSRVEWRGSFVPDDGKPMNTGNATIGTNDWTGEVLVQDSQFSGAPGSGTAILLGQDMPPF